MRKVQHKILVEKIKAFGGTVCQQLDHNTTHVVFLRGVKYRTDMASLELPDTVSFVTIDRLPSCIPERKLIPTTQFEVSEKNIGLPTKHASFAINDKNSASLETN